METWDRQGSKSIWASRGKQIQNKIRGDNTKSKNTSKKRWDTQEPRHALKDAHWQDKNEGKPAGFIQEDGQVGKDQVQGGAKPSRRQQDMGNRENTRPVKGLSSPPFPHKTRTCPHLSPATPVWTTEQSQTTLMCQSHKRHGNENA